MRIILSGAKASGKSTIGIVLAKRLGLDFIDLDDVILERDRMKSPDAPSCAEIYRLHGETYFRSLERDAIAEINHRHRCILSTGGSTLLDPISRNHLKAHSIWVFLDASWRYLWDRISSNNIPAYLENCASPAASFRERVFRIRETVMPLSNIQVAVEKRPPDEIVDEIIGRLSRSEATLSDTLKRTPFYSAGAPIHRKNRERGLQNETKRKRRKELG